MTSEIKFRAWLPDMGKMIYSDDPDSMNEADSYIGLESGTVEVFTIESRGDDTEYYSEEYNDAILMQFTGFHDKNGVEIYEGDIIRHNRGFTNKPRILNGTVIFSCGMFGLMIPSGFASFVHISFVEVIGNIHMNPELLEA